MRPDVQQLLGEGKGHAAEDARRYPGRPPMHPGRQHTGAAGPRRALPLQGRHEASRSEQNTREIETQPVGGKPVELNQVAETLRAIDPVWEVLDPVLTL